MNMSMSIGEMILTGESGSIRRKPCLSASFSNTNLTRTGLVLNPDLRAERPVTDHLSHDTGLYILPVSN